MKKLLAFVIITTSLLCLVSCGYFNHEHIVGEWQDGGEFHWRETTCKWNRCDINPLIENHLDEDANDLCDICGSKHEHIFGDWQFGESDHWCSATCTWYGCDIDTVAEHFDREKNNICDACGYDGLNYSYEIAKIVADYEDSLKNDINKLNEEDPEYTHFYNPVERVQCMYLLASGASADAIAASYDMNNLFADAEVSALNAFKVINLFFSKNDFTEFMHQKFIEISEEEPLIESVHVQMHHSIAESYMPKIEYYAESPVALDYEIAKSVSNTSSDKCLIIKSKEEYDNYISDLLANIEDSSFKETVSAQKDLYNEAFFEENALVITKTITRSSGSIKLTVDNLYLSEGKVYVVVRTDVPSVCTSDIQYTSFTLKVPKDQVINAGEVITLK